jgi:hypothetical protein
MPAKGSAHQDRRPVVISLTTARDVAASTASSAEPLAPVALFVCVRAGKVALDYPGTATQARGVLRPGGTRSPLQGRFGRFLAGDAGKSLTRLSLS